MEIIGIIVFLFVCLGSGIFRNAKDDRLREMAKMNGGGIYIDSKGVCRHVVTNHRVDLKNPHHPDYGLHWYDLEINRWIDKETGQPAPLKKGKWVEKREKREQIRQQYREINKRRQSDSMEERDKALDDYIQLTYKVCEMKKRKEI